MYESKFLKILKGVEVFSPEYLGKKDIIIAADKIAFIDDKINYNNSYELYDGENLIAVPGFIDSHAHITGGGGEGGFHLRTYEIDSSDIFNAGVTTIIGCLGTDGITRSLENLYAKTKSLEWEGLTTFMYTGSYHIPLLTITGEIVKDLVLIDKVIGIGEIAISDHRSSQPTFNEFKRVSSEARLGGILSGKAGIVNIHLGSGKDGFLFLNKAVDETDIPISQFLPTHSGRSPEIFNQAVDFALKGGTIDFTSSTNQFPEKGLKTKVSKVIKRAIDKGVSINNITISSDAQGSLPEFDSEGKLTGYKVGSIKTLFNAFKDLILEENLKIGEAVRIVSTNPAKILTLKNKGEIKEGNIADILLLDKNSLEIDSLFSKGETIINKGEFIKENIYSF